MPETITPAAKAAQALEAQRAAELAVVRARQAADKAVYDLRRTLGTPKRAAGGVTIARAINAAALYPVISPRAVDQRIARATTGRPRQRAGAEARERAQRIAARHAVQEVVA